MRAAAAAALLLLGTASGALAQSGPLQGLDAYVEQAMRDWEIPGFALAVVRDDSVIHARGYGVLEVGKPARVDENTVFAVASTSKAFTVSSLGMLVDEGKLDWDDRATEHLTGFQLFDPYVTRELTLRDMLSHRSGLARGDRLWWGSPFDRDEILHRVRFQEPSTSFRSSYGYQNVMFLAAGEMIPAITGKSWDRFVAERIFQPLGMRRTTTTVSALAGMDNVATPHMTIDGNVVPIEWRSFDNLGGAGAINSSVHDMAQWIRLHLNRGEYGGRRLLSEAVVREMQSPNTVIRSDTSTERMYPETHLRAYGMGWTLQDYRGYKMVSHGGALDGMKTQVTMIPELGIGVVAIANLDESNLQAAIAYRVIDALMGRKPARDWSADLLAARERAVKRGEEREAKREAERVAGTRPSLALPRYAGVYVDSMYGEVRVEERGGKLRAFSGADFQADLEHWHYDTFRADWDDPQAGRSMLTFRLSPRGEVASVVVEGLGEFRRAPDAAPPAAATGR